MNQAKEQPEEPETISPKKVESESISSTATTPSTTTTTTTTTDQEDVAASLQTNEKLLTALSKQLQYYLSPQNLSKDTYLNRIMQLNSGFVPITILTTFANVNRIIARFTTSSNGSSIDIAQVDVNALLHKSAMRASPSGDATDTDTETETETEPDTAGDTTATDAPTTTSKATATLLKIVLLDKLGNVISTCGDEDYNEKRAEVLTFEAIGSYSEYKSMVEVQKQLALAKKQRRDDEGTADAAAADGDVGEKRYEQQQRQEQQPPVEEEQTEDKNTTSSIVILRDVPEIATEDDVRAVFQSGDDGDSTLKITHLQKEVGQCWFVTIESSALQHDMVSILLDLRSKTICNEPIKARLKSQSIAINSRSNQQQHYNNRQYNNGSSYNPYRGGYRNNNTSSYMNQHKIYSGDRLSYPRKFNTTTNNRSFPKQRGRKGSESSSNYHPHQYNPHHSGMKRTDSSNSLKGEKDSTENKVEKVLPPPPPLVDEHFPGLGNTASPKSVGDDNNSAPASSVPTSTTIPNSGYAAALLKSAPPLPDVPLSQPDKHVRVTDATDTNPTPPTNANKSKSPVRKKNEDAKSITSTEDSSTDDKSSLCSKHDADTPSTATTVPAPATGSAWGGGRSFAEILKKVNVETSAE